MDVSAAATRGGLRWRVASYARLSREDGCVGISDSITGQLMMIADWADKREGAQVVAEYADDGYSGATFDRPGFKRMIDDAGRGLFDTIVVKDLSRFGRSYLDCGSWIERDLPRLGVRLFSIADDFDSMRQWDYNMAMLLPMKNLMNEMLVITTSEKVRTSLAAKRERGECVANFAPYGYRKDPADRHRLVVDPPAAAVVLEMFEKRAGGASASAIARDLNGRGVECPAAHKEGGGSRYRCHFAGEAPKWHAKTVLRILRDETYVGTLAQGKTRRPSWRMRTDVPVAPDEWHRTPGAHEAIVGVALFDRVQRLLRGAGGGREAGTGAGGGVAAGAVAVPAGAVAPAGAGGGRKAGAFDGRVHLVCADCGAPMKRLRIGGGRAAGKEYVYYVCARHRRDVRSCSTHSVREEALFEQLEPLLGGFDGQARTVRVRSDGTAELAGLEPA